MGPCNHDIAVLYAQDLEQKHYAYRRLHLHTTLAGSLPSFCLPLFYRAACFLHLLFTF